MLGAHRKGTALLPRSLIVGKYLRNGGSLKP
jgi:hypothetical protein